MCVLFNPVSFKLHIGFCVGGKMSHWSHWSHWFPLESHIGFCVGGKMSHWFPCEPVKNVLLEYQRHSLFHNSAFTLL
uniref:Uncharacterized protein n=1 Tax=Oncorhynchus mykiss TaxID=8022 RepID=A0A8K9XQP7_ONCMY